MVSIDATDEPDPKWNERLIKAGLGTTSQIKEAASFLRLNNQKPVFLKFINSNGAIAGQLLLAEFSRFESLPHRIKPSKKRMLANKLLKNVPGITKKVYRWSYGPLIFDPESTSGIYSELGSFLIKSKNQVSGWEHPLSSSKAKSRLKKFQLVPWSTYLIDLSVSTDTLYQNLEKHSCRKNIERSKKRNVILEEINEKNLKEYFELRKQLKKLGGQKSEFNFFLKRWKMLKQFGQSGFLARWKDKPVGGLLFTYYSGYIIEAGVARAKEDYENNLYSQDQIRWEIIKWGIKNKMQYYDLAGFNPSSPSQKESGIQRYKKKWGGKKHDFFNIQIR